MFRIIFHLLISHTAFLALLLDPEFWASFSTYHEEATKSIARKWQQLQLVVQTPPTTIIEDDSDDEYEQWVDNEILRFQNLLQEIGDLEADMMRAKEVGVAVKQTRKWVAELWGNGHEDFEVR